MKKLLFTLILIQTVVISRVSAQSVNLDVEYLQYLTPKGDLFRSAYVWNVDSGHALRFYYDFNSSEWKESTSKMPEKPFGDKTGNGPIRMDVSEMFNRDGSEQWRSILYVRGEDSARWYFDHGKGEWIKSDALIPKDSLMKLTQVD